MHGEQSTGTKNQTLPDPADAADLAEFIALLDALRVRAGEPSYRTLARRVGPLMRPPRTVGQSTVGAVFQPRRRRLDLDLVLAIVRALGLDEPAVDRWREAYLRVQREAKSGSAAGVFRQLPGDLAAFTGREAHLAVLLDAATRPAGGASNTVVITAIEGMAGVGKTQLALHAAHRLVQTGHFTDLQLYANLRGFDPDRPPADPAAVLDSFLRQLGVPAQHVPETLEERGAMYRDRLHGRSVLVVLDNAADAQQVRELIPGGPGCPVLITSRRSLKELPDATVLMLDVFSPQESLDLLARIAGPERIGAEQQAALRIVESCGGLPLAVALAGARLRSRPAGSLRQLADRLAAGAGAEHGATAVFAMSYQGLPKTAQRVFRLLGIDPGLDATVDSVAALAGITPDEADEILELLQDENLLGQKAPERFELHDLLRAFAAETCRAVDAETKQHEATGRYLDWYLHSAGAAMDVVSPGRARPADAPGAPGALDPEFADADAARSWLTAERANLLAATRHAADSGRPGHAWRFSQALWQFYFVSSYHGDWAESCRYGLAAAEAENDTFGQAEIWHARGIAEAVAGRFDRALEFTGTALRFRELAGQEEHLAPTLGNLGCIYYDLGRARDAVPIFLRTRDLMRKLGKPRGEAQSLNNLAVAAAAMGRHREAVAHVTESADLLRSVDGDADVLCTALGSLALSLSHLGEHDRARAAVTEALDLADRIGARRKLAETLNVSGQAATQRGDFAEAEALFCKARQLACEIDAHIEQTESAVCLGDNALLQGDPVAALEFLEQAEKLIDGQERNRWKVRIAQHKGDAYLALGDMAQAHEHFAQALAWPESSYIVAKGRAAYGLARIALAEDPPDRHAARERLREALRILDETELDSLKQTVRAVLAEVEFEAEADCENPRQASLLNGAATRNVLSGTP